MSVTTNIVAKFKQLFHAAGANSNSVSDAIDALNDFYIDLKIPNGFDGNAASAAANASVTVPVFVDAKLIGAKLSTTTAIANTTGDDVVITVATNGVTVATFNSNAAVSGAVAANGVANITVTTTNSFVDAGEKILVAYTMGDVTNNYPNGILSLQLRRQ
jgi:hypothetical protein